MKCISLRNILFGLWLFLFPLLLMLFAWPVNTSFLRIFTLAALAGALVGLLFFSWPHRIRFLSLLALLTALFSFMLFPGNSQIDIAELQTQSATEMIKFQDVPYRWGGESRFGIDCSGLIRKSFQNMLLKEGAITLNPFLLRGAIDLWWNDATAATIGEGYQERTRFVLRGESLNGIDSARLQPGDMAVTTSGIHILAYLGNNRWINADPSKGKVSIFQIPDAANSWSLTPVTIVRWNKIKG